MFSSLFLFEGSHVHVTEVNRKLPKVALKALQAPRGSRPRQRGAKGSGCWGPVRHSRGLGMVLEGSGPWVGVLGCGL